MLTRETLGRTLAILILGVTIGAVVTYHVTNGERTVLERQVDTRERTIKALEQDVDSLESELRWWDRYVRPDSSVLHQRISQHRTEAEADSLTQWFIAYGMQVGLSPRLLLAVSHVESKHNRWARSSAGALGVMQVMPRIWWTTFAAECGYWRRGDARVNICYGAHVLRYYYDACDGRLRCALSRYNSNYDYDRSSQGRQYADDVLRNYQGVIE